MADTAIAITAGSGTNVDTRTEATNGNHRQVVVLGDPSTNAGVAPVDATAGLKVDLGADNDVTIASLPALAAGTNNIGDVDVLSIAAGDNNIGNVDLASAIPAGTNNIGDVDVLTLPADPLGANADAAATAGSEGSLSAKLRLVTSQLDSIKTAVETLDNTVGGTELQVDIVGALPAGTNGIGKLTANSGVDIGDVDVTSISAGSNLIGDVQLQGRATGGVDIFRSIDLDESEEEIKATAGTLFGYYFSNSNASARFLKFYNATAANVTVGTTTPVLTFYLPATSAGHVGFPYGVAFSTAITAAATTAVADNDTGAPGANEVILNAFYK